MATKLFVVTNYSLTPEQVKDVQDSLAVTEFIEMPDYLKTIWNNIPPESLNINPLIDPIKDWLLEQGETGGMVLIHGDCFATYGLKRWCRAVGLFAPVSVTYVKVPADDLDSIKVSQPVYYRRYMSF